MQLTFVPGVSSRKKGFIDIPDIELTEAIFFEELFSKGLNSLVRLRLAHLREPEVIAIELSQSITDDDAPSAIAFIPLKKLLALCPDYETLNEEPIPFADKPGYRIDSEWFEERAQRLGVVWNNREKFYTIPAQSLSAIIMSYLMSSLGIIEVTKEEIGFSTRNKQNYFCLKLLALGKEEISFQEVLFIAEDEIEARINSTQFIPTSFS